MPNVDLKSAYRVRAKGKVYWYAWKGKGAPRLYAEPGSLLFIKELNEALENRRAGDKTRVSALIAAYKADDMWKVRCSPKTRQNWGPWLDRIGAKFGALRIAHFDRPDIKRDIKKWHSSYRATPRSADMGLQVLSHLMAYAVSEGEINANPCAGIEHLYDVDRSELIWAEDDLAELAKHASAAVMQAARLASLTGLRKSDLLRLSWSHVGQYAIEIRTGKSGEKKTAVIPLYDDLRNLLAEIPRRSTTVLTNSAGHAWRTGFSSSWNKAKKAAGMDELHFHDLRGTAATRFYLAGLSIREIAEIMTWGEDRVELLIDRYVKRDEILKDRIRRLARTGTEHELEKPQKNRPDSGGV